MKMVEQQIRRRGVRNARVLGAMEKVPRHRFVPKPLIDQAYTDSPLSIGKGQTISQPYMVALMTALLDPKPEDRVLEVGAGSGYQTAILAELAGEVYSIERIPELAEEADRLLSELGYENISIRVGDGSKGWVEASPFAGILVTAGAPDVPAPLLEQLALDGRLVIPIGGAYHQTLYRILRDAKGTQRSAGTGCVFVPLIGAHGWSEKTANGFP